MNGPDPERPSELTPCSSPKLNVPHGPEDGIRDTGRTAPAKSEAQLKAKSAEDFFQIALTSEQKGQLLDAYHACRHSLTLNEGDDAAEQMFQRLRTALKQPTQTPPLPSEVEYKFSCPHCGQHISANEFFAETEVNCPSCAGSFTAPPPLKAQREIGPDDYVNPYVLLNLAEARDLPKACEWFDRPALWDKLLGSLTRRRRALKSEFELNHGRLPWLPQLHITAEVVHRVLSRLDDNGWHPHHWAVFRLPLLNRFLMHGALDYFHSLEHAPYPLAAELAGATPGNLQQEQFIAFISPFFRHRWAMAIKESLDAADYAGAVALFATRPPLTTADLDKALEPMRRHFSRRCKVLKQIESSVKSGDTTNPTAQFQPAVGEAKLLNILPAHFGEKLRDDLCSAYHGIGIALYNHRNDYTKSVEALTAAGYFQTSVTTKQGLEKTRGVIDNNLTAAAHNAKQQEARLSRSPVPVQGSTKKKSATRETLLALGIVGAFILFLFISAPDPNKTSSSSPYPNPSGSTPSSYTAPPPTYATLLPPLIPLLPTYTPPSPKYTARGSTHTVPSPYTAPQTYTAPSPSGTKDKPTYLVPSHVSSELDRDKQAIENEKAKTTALERRLENSKQAVDREKAMSAELENQITDMNAQVERTRLYLDKTSQADVDEFNRKVSRYNAMLSNVRAANERMNQAVDNHNAILEQVRAQDRIVNRMVDDYNAKLRRYGR